MFLGAGAGSGIGIGTGTGIGTRTGTGIGTAAMAQLRLTDFFGQTKATTGAPAKRSGGHRLKAALAGPPVHREEEKEKDGVPAGLSARSLPLPGSPRTPARGGSPALRGLAGRKRSRREMEAESPVGPRLGEPSVKSARKRLELPRDAEAGSPGAVGRWWGRGCAASSGMRP